MTVAASMTRCQRNRVVSTNAFSTASSVEASTRQGEIEVHLVPENPNSSLHINLKTDIGGIILYLPKQFKASIEAIVDRPLFTGESIIADFPMNAVNAFAASARGVGNTVGIGARRPSDALRGAFASGSDSRTGTLNGGGNSVKLHANLGTISIKLKIN